MASDEKENGMASMILGMLLIMSGNSALILGIYLWINGAIAVGNIFHFCGVAFIFWLRSAFHLFKKPTNIKGMILFGAGFLLIIIGWPILGLIFEIYGFFFYLYSDIIRVILQMISSKIPLCIEVK